MIFTTGGGGKSYLNFLLKFQFLKEDINFCKL